MKQNQLIIVRDRRNVNDKGSDRFERALRGECNRKDVEVIISDSLNESNKTTPTIVLQPSDIVIEGYLDVDIAVTAEVCYDIIRGMVNTSSLLTSETLIFGNGITIGKPLRNMIKDRSDWYVDYIDSKTSDSKKGVLIDDCGIVVLALPFGLKVEESLKGKLIIDCSDSYRGVADYDVKDIGKLTVQKIVQNVLMECQK